MLERDWDADFERLEKHIGLCDLANGFYLCGFDIDIMVACLAERRRLAAMLEWKPGPPTEPGFYAYVGRYGDPIATSYDRATVALMQSDKDRLYWSRYQFIGPLPEPPKAEVVG